MDKVKAENKNKELKEKANALILKGKKNGSLTFEEIEQYQVLLKSAKSEITLKGKDAEQYPRIQEVDSLTPLIMDTKMLKSIIAETSFAASTQDSRPILTGVHFVL